MTIQHILLVAKTWLAVVVVLALLPWLGIGNGPASAEAHLMKRAERGDSVRSWSRWDTYDEVTPSDPLGRNDHRKVLGSGGSCATGSLLNCDTCAYAWDPVHGTMLINAEAQGHERHARLFKVTDGGDSNVADKAMGPRQSLSQKTPSAAGKGDAYPSTPAGVVAAFAKAGFHPASAEELFEHDDVRERRQYYTEALNPGYDCLPIVLSYKIGETRVNGNVARVKVIYREIGDVCTDDLILRKSGKRIETVYRLENHDGRWRIYFPYEPPHVSIKTAIALFQCRIEKDRPPLNRVRDETLKKNINILRRLQESCAPHWR